MTDSIDSRPGMKNHLAEDRMICVGLAKARLAGQTLTTAEREVAMVHALADLGCRLTAAETAILVRTA